MEFEYKTPHADMEEQERKAIVYNFCTLCSLLENKKLSFQTVFMLLINDEDYRNLLKGMLNSNSIKETLADYLTVAPDVSKSKQVLRQCKNISL